jgi:hypothetical protein
MGVTMFGVKVKKFVVEPLDGYGIALTFSVSFKPEGQTVAQIAEFLQEEIDINLYATDGELALS